MEHNWIDIIKKVLDEERINSSDFDLNHNIVLPSDRKLNRAGVLVGTVSYTHLTLPTILLV